MKINKKAHGFWIRDGHLWAVDGDFLYAYPIEGADGLEGVARQPENIIGKEFDGLVWDGERIKALVGMTNLWVRVDQEEVDREFPPTQGTPVDVDAAALKRVMGAASSEQYRAVFRGVQFEPGGRCAATNSFLLLLSEGCHTLPIEEPLLIEAKMLKEIYNKPIVYVGHEEWPIFGLKGGAKVYLPKMEGRLPDYEHAITKPDQEREIPDPALWAPLKAIKDATKKAKAWAIRWTPEGVWLVDRVRGRIGQIPTLSSAFEHEVQLDAQAFLKVLEHVGEGAKAYQRPAVKPRRQPPITFYSDDGRHVAVLAPMYRLRDGR